MPQGGRHPDWLGHRHELHLMWDLALRLLGWVVTPMWVSPLERQCVAAVCFAGKCWFLTRLAFSGGQGHVQSVQPFDCGF